jgi:undecaprenyl diphosphate synthase
VRIPRHVAIIMDGNGRWAERRGLPRSAGHRAGVKPVRVCVQECTRLGVGALTLFAFSSENWRRPGQEVGLLMQLFLESLDLEIDELAKNGVQLRFAGDRASLAPALEERMSRAEALTRDNPGLRLVVAIAYGGRWDIVQAARRLARECRAGQLEPEAIDERRFAAELALAGLPDPDLFIRTGGTLRISNFLLWNLAYTELWFSDKLWPEFDATDFEAAFAAFADRERRYGYAGAPPGVDTC